jgi:glycine/D-amino acid oxidase-like deaminating enzyme
VTQQPRQQPMSADALVIGAGVVGSSIALQLARAGLAVTVLDRNRAVGGRVDQRLVRGGPVPLLHQGGSDHVLGVEVRLGALG